MVKVQNENVLEIRGQIKRYTRNVQYDVTKEERIYRNLRMRTDKREKKTTG